MEKLFRNSLCLKHQLVVWLDFQRTTTDLAGALLCLLPCVCLWVLSGQQHLTVQTMQGGGLQLATTQGQPTIQVDQTLTLELPGQPGEKKRRMACTCPNCKDADKRWVCQICADITQVSLAVVQGETSNKEARRDLDLWCCKRILPSGNGSHGQIFNSLLKF